MDLNEIRNKITDLLYGTTAPSGQIWTAIHEIEDQYKAEIKKLQEDLHFAVDDVIAGEVKIAKLRDDLEASRAEIADISLSLNLTQRELNAAVAGMRFRGSEIERLLEKCGLLEAEVDHLSAEWRVEVPK